MAETARKRVQESQGLDRISDLPTPILTSILSLVPIKQAARTSVLSKNWRYIWNSITNLYLNDTDFHHRGSKWLSIVYHILHSRLDPIDRCCFYFKFVKLYTNHFDNFILCLNNKGIRELVLTNVGTNLYQITPYVFFCSALRKLELLNCEVAIPPSFKSFGYLKTLQFSNVLIACNHLERLISCCPVLEKLSLDHCMWGRSLSIPAPNLLSLEILSGSSVGISLKDLTQLEHASFSFVFPCTNRVYMRYLRKLEKENKKKGNITGQLVELLKNLGHVQSLYLKFECLSVEKKPKSLPVEKVVKSLPVRCQLVKLKKLTMEISLADANAVFLLSCLLRSCPHMQDLIIQASMIGPSGVSVEHDYWEKQRPSDCSMYQLRTVQIECLDLLCDYEIGFVKYLLMTAHVLKRMSIKHYTCTRRRVLDVEIGLLLVRMASPRAVLELKDALIIRSKTCSQCPFRK
ncbi:F-box/FBD/LRR-repeat protein At1g13570-like isoform X2 [Tasmannia lanceolata]|uniref:F-box/FBD/LRR-repeat protein At1g13570-like isoform X2 n=1 Tax=Tasmannia lanceolata TaxID=3420 RepID=UPI004062A5B2